MTADFKHSYLVATTAGALILAVFYLYNKQKKKTIPKKWKPIGEVKNIYLYPLKSGRAIELKEAECTTFGIQTIHSENGGFRFRDRCFAVYNAANKQFLSARTYSNMVLITVKEHLSPEGTVAIDAPGMQTLYVKIPKVEEKGTNEDKITMWKDEVLFTLDCGDEAASWFSRYILGKDEGLRLGFYPEHRRRDISRSHQKYFKYYKDFNNESTGMYSDFTSYMFINQSSVDELNTRLSSPVTHKYFRPTVVIQGEGTPPFAEDNWKWVKIGDVVFLEVKPCSRCAFTVINPETGVRSSGREPLKTLETYRRLGKHLKRSTLEANSAIMGIHLGLEKPGNIHVGDVVYVPE